VASKNAEPKRIVVLRACKTNPGPEGACPSFGVKVSVVTSTDAQPNKECFITSLLDLKFSFSDLVNKGLPR
jgi:hypothetical protein